METKHQFCMNAPADFIKVWNLHLPTKAPQQKPLMNNEFRRSFGERTQKGTSGWLSKTAIVAT
jgi:hypothetical protein